MAGLGCGQQNHRPLAACKIPRRGISPYACRAGFSPCATAAPPWAADRRRGERTDVLPRVLSPASELQKWRRSHGTGSHGHGSKPPRILRWAWIPAAQKLPGGLKLTGLPAETGREGETNASQQCGYGAPTVGPDQGAILPGRKSASTPNAGPSGRAPPAPAGFSRIRGQRAGISGAALLFKNKKQRLQISPLLVPNSQLAKKSAPGFCRVAFLCLL